MSSCQRSHECPFYLEVEPSIVKRVKYASAFMYCKGGHQGECALASRIAAGQDVPMDLLPDGSMGDWTHGHGHGARTRFLIIEDSPVFVALASATIASNFSDAEIVRHHSLADAEADLLSGGFAAVVCGYGLGEGLTAHDVRKRTAAPIVVLTGRLEGVEAPSGARIVEKSAGPQALVGALQACLS